MPGPRAMKNLIVPCALLLAGGLALSSISRAHGGTYRGPGDTVPGGGGGGGGGASPTGPGGSGSGAGGPTGPGGPSRPGTPTGGAPGGAAGSIPTGGQDGSDLTSWEFWWGFNRAPYLNLKAAIYHETATDADVFFQGAGAQRHARDSIRPSQETIRGKIVPALERALETERANDIVTGAMVALARIGEIRGEDGRQRIAPRIRPFLADPNQEIAETAAAALGIPADEASIADLQDLLSDTGKGRKLCGRSEVPYRTRAFAAYSLGLIGDRAVGESRVQVARILLGALSGPEASTRDVKVAALLALGLVPLDFEAGEDAAASAGAGDSRQAQIRRVEQILRDEHVPSLVRAHVPGVLAKLLAGAPAETRRSVARLLVGPLSEGSKEKDDVKEGCVLALGQIGDCDGDETGALVRAALKRAATDRDALTKAFALISMAQVGGRRGTGEKGDVGRKDALDFLVESLTQGRQALRPWAGLALGVMEHARLEGGAEPAAAAVGALRDALRDCTTPADLGAYAIGAGIARDADAKTILREKLKMTREAIARGYLAVALGLLDDRDAISDIQTIVKESKYQPELLRQAAIGLGLLGDRTLVPDLVKMLADARALSVQASVASALGFIGDSRSVDPLVALLERKDVTDSARGLAAAALGLLADKEPLPWNAKYSVNVNYVASTSTLTGGNGTGILDIL